MNILSIYYTHKPGGFCKRLYRLLNALAGAGHQVTYLCLDKPLSGLSPKVTVSLIPFPTKTRSGVVFWLAFTPWAAFWLTISAFRLRAEKIAVFGAYYGALCYPAQKLLAIPSILFIRSLVYKINRITEKPALLCWCSDLLERFGMKGATTLVAMSISMAAELKVFLAKTREIKVLPNDCSPHVPGTNLLDPTISVLIEQKKQSGKILVLISGVFDKRKNLALVIETIIELSKKIPHHLFELIVAGAGTEILPAKEKLAAHSTDCVTFIGWVAALEPLFPLMDLVIHPSKHEGMPNSVLEAWGLGCPTLLADIPELREIVHGEDLLFDTSNYTELLRRLEEIHQNPEPTLEGLRQSTIRARQYYSFDWEQRAVELVENLKV